MTEYLSDQPYYFLHTLVGARSRELGRMMISAGRSEQPLHHKVDLFLNASPETPEGVNLALGLDLREVMCTVSKRSPAVHYHDNYGLVMEGNVKACFDNDSGCDLQEDGTYSAPFFDFANSSSPEALMGDWYDEYEARKGSITWNEVILEKGSRVAGVFFDSDKPPLFPDYPKVTGRTEGEEYDLFLEKARRCGLAVLHIQAKF
jgi:hypothetical protein